MQRIKLDQDIKPLSEFRANITALIEKLKKNKRPIVITQNGKSSAVMMDVSEYEALLDKIDLLTNIHLAETQIREGKGVLHHEALRKVKTDLGL